MVQVDNQTLGETITTLAKEHKPVHHALSPFLADAREIDLAIHLLIESVKLSVLPGTNPPSEVERQLQNNMGSVKAQHVDIS